MNRLNKKYSFKLVSNILKIENKFDGLIDELEISEKSIDFIKENKFNLIFIESCCPNVIIICFDDYKDYVLLAEDMKKVDEEFFKNNDLISIELFTLIHGFEEITKGLGKKNYKALIERKISEIKTKREDSENQLAVIDYYSLSSMFGAFLGDSLGSYSEFQPGKPNLYNDKIIFKSQNPIWKTAPGQVTDDSELAIFQGFGINDGRTYDINRVAYYYGLWYFTDPFDIGKTTRNAVEAATDYSCNLLKGQRFDFSKKLNYIYQDKLIAEEFMKRTKYQSSASNGFLMKNTPLATYCMRYVVNYKLNNINDTHFDHEGFEQMKKDISDDRYLTHFIPEVFFSSLLYINLVTRLIYLNAYYPELTIQEKCKNTIDSVHLMALQLKDDIGKGGDNRQLFNFLNEVIHIAECGSPINFEFDSQSYYKEMGYHLKALAQAIFQVRKIINLGETKGAYLSCIKEIINLGGDTDTNASIAGGALGAILGLDNFPEDLFEILYTFNPKFDKISEKTRPAIFSPGLAVFLVNSMNRDERLKNGFPYTISRIILGFLEQK